MSLSTLAPSDDFEAFEFAALVADFTQPLGEPLPEADVRMPARLSRAALRREADEQIRAELGIRRHRSREREV